MDIETPVPDPSTYLIDQRLASDPELAQEVAQDAQLNRLAEITRRNEQLIKLKEENKRSYLETEEELSSMLTELRHERADIFVTKVTGEYGGAAIVSTLTGMDTRKIRHERIKVGGAKPDPKRSAAARSFARKRSDHSLRARLLKLFKELHDDCGHPVYLTLDELRDRGFSMPSLNNTLGEMVKAGEIHRPPHQVGHYGYTPADDSQDQQSE